MSFLVNNNIYVPSISEFLSMVVVRHNTASRWLKQSVAMINSFKSCDKTPGNCLTSPSISAQASRYAE